MPLQRAGTPYLIDAFKDHAGTGAEIQVTDTGGAAQVRRFYRLVAAQ